MRQCQVGLTLVEMLVVISIIVMISALVFPVITASRLQLSSPHL